MKHYVLYNPLAGNGRGKQEAELLEVTYENTVFQDITGLLDITAFLRDLEKDDVIILCGGDGTLQHFADSIAGFPLENEVFFYAIGSGNDFARDLDFSYRDGPVNISAFLKGLPQVTVNGNTCRFINGIGFGIDGYCCEEGDRQRAGSQKPVNYPLIAIKGLLWAFRPTGATVTVDGVRHRYEKVWLAATMHGRFYGGGMMMAPLQNRLNREGIVSVTVVHGAGKLRLLSVFPSIFRGEHIRHRNIVATHSGKTVSVEFDSPKPLQIDGETVSQVRSYTVQTKNARHK